MVSGYLKRWMTRPVWWQVSAPVHRIGSNTEREDTGSGGFFGNGVNDLNKSIGWHKFLWLCFYFYTQFWQIKKKDLDNHCIVKFCVQTILLYRVLNICVSNFPTLSAISVIIMFYMDLMLWRITQGDNEENIFEFALPVPVSNLMCPYWPPNPREDEPMDNIAWGPEIEKYEFWSWPAHQKRSCRGKVMEESEGKRLNFQILKAEYYLSNFES